ncbi:choice-of-anchor tandem repeat GloVer-containing protein [Fulvivirga sp.]|uniref:choice-of-anchor tandem repeat GloVer-containing protein n=3 Tax=Fulvivirga sp. TaxID=1931237 RepID=UPI0032EE8384
MKLIFSFTLSIFLYPILIFGQTSVPQLVGAGANGSIYRLSNGQVVDLFQLNTNQRPEEVELLVKDEKLWGITTKGGAYNNGVIFFLNQDGSGYTKVHDFSGSDGSDPYGGLVEYENKLWGFTLAGGDNNLGVLFSIETNGDNFLVEHNFRSEDGNGPSSLVVIDGTLWGTAKSGGTHSYGTIFTYSNTGGLIVRHNFNYTDGYFPTGKLIESNGRLWGVTLVGGDFGYGTIYSIRNDGTDFTVYDSFDHNNTGFYPRSGIIKSNGTIFGTTSNGTIYSIDNTGGGIEVLYRFNQIEPEIAASPIGRLLAFNEKLWGVSFEGGDYDAGFIYNINEDGTNFTNLYSFKKIDADGRNPWCTLVELNGRLWGSTTTGGNKGNGIIFSIADHGSDYKVEHTFNDIVVTGYPANSDFIEIDNQIIGTTQSGGNNNYGTICRFNKDGSQYEILHHFEYNDGNWPTGGLVEYSGKLWGMTQQGGDFNYGTIFSINLDGTGFTKWHDFTSTTGIRPVGRLILHNDLLWGVTSAGSQKIFYYNPNSEQYIVVHDIGFINGPYPESGLLLSNGKFWGMTGGGTDNFGIIYTLNDDGTNYTVVHDFDFSNGGGKLNGPLIEVNNRIWGTTEEGGTNLGGTIFSIGKDGNNFLKHHDFAHSPSSSPTGPVGRLTYFENRLYGITKFGGDDLGTVFSINASGTDFRKEVDLASGSAYLKSGNLIPITFINYTPSDIAIDSNSINENQPIATVIGQLSALDENNDTQAFTLVTGDGINDVDNNFFEIVDNELKTLQSFNYEEKSEYSIFVRTTDSFGETFEKGFLITVNDINEAPSIENESFSIDEGSEVSAVVGNLGSTDPEDNDITYTIISGNTDNAFSISADGNLIVTNASAIDFEENAEFALTVEVSDGELVNEGVLIISLNDINEAPIIGNQSFTIDEGSEASTVVGNLGASDPEEDVISYSITSGNTNDAFSIDVDGNLVVNNSSAIDFEATPEFTLSVELSDGNLVTESAVTITLNDINFAPTDILLSSTSFDENSDEGTIVGQLSATDEPGDTGSFTLVAGDGTNDVNNSSFEIIGNDIKTLESFNYEEKNEYFILIRATDSFGEIFEKEFTISVNDINEAPIVEDKGFTIPEGSETGTVVGNIEATDEDNDELSFSITTGNTGATFSITADGEIIVDTPSALDFDTTPTFNLVVEVSDGELASEVNVEITLEQVTGIEDLPEGFSIYPNPAKNQLQIESLKSFTAEILNQAGQTVLEETSNNVIDVSILKSGLYTLKLKHDNKVETVRFIKE